jgi:hypothetical protein
MGTDAGRTDLVEGLIDAATCLLTLRFLSRADIKLQRGWLPECASYASGSNSLSKGETVNPVP